MARSSRPNWILRIAGVLLCLTLLSVHLTSGMMARYSTTVSGSDSARVAKFDLREAGTFSQDLPLEYKPGMSESYTIVLENHSEVTVDCTVTVKQLSNNMPITVTITPTPGTVQLAPNDTTGKTYTLTLTWPAEYNDARYSYEVDAIRVIVDAVQVD